MANPFQDVVLAIAEGLARWDPEHGSDVDEGLSGLVEVTSALAASLQDIATSMSDKQQLMTVAEGCRVMAQAVASAESVGQEVLTDFRQQNSFWLG